MIIDTFNVSNDRLVSLGHGPPASSSASEVDVNHGEEGVGNPESLLAYWLRRASRQLARAHEDLANSLALKPRELVALSLISHNPGITSAELADLLDLRRPNFVAVLHVLEARGLVVRCPHAEDRRAKRLVVSAAGLELVQYAEPIARGSEEVALACLGSAERQSLVELLRKICEACRRG